MRGIAVFISGLFVLSAITMAAGVLYDPIVQMVANDAAVQAQGWDSSVTNISDAVLQWMPAIWIAYLLTWAGAWYLRRERHTGVRR